MAGQIGQLAFVIGTLIAILAGILPTTWSGQITLVLVVLGLVVGFLNITEKETTPFLIAGIALIATQGASSDLANIPPAVLGSFLAAAVSNIAVFVAPAAILVAVKAIYALAKS